MVTGPDGSRTELPRNEYCWPCAVTLECWPNDEIEDLYEKYVQQAAFRTEVQQIREGVLRCRAQLQLERVTVEKRTEVCTRMIRRFNFVYAVPFSKYFGVPLDQITDMCVQMRTPDLDYCEGVLIRGAVPDDLDHDQVEISTSMARTKVDELASAETCFRSGQASERFERAAAAQIANRPLGMKAGANARRPLTFAELKSKVEAEDAKRLQDFGAATAGLRVNGGVAASVSVSASRLDDDDGDAMCAPTGKGKGRQSKGFGKGRGRSAAAQAAAVKSPRATADQSRPDLRRHRLPVAAVPVFGGNVTPAFPGATPGSFSAVPCTPAFRLTSGPSSIAGPAGGGDSAIDLMSCDAGSEADACEVVTIHDMMNLAKVIVEQEAVDKRKLRKASLG